LIWLLNSSFYKTLVGGIITRQVDYTYDALDRRIAKRINANGAAAGGVSTERYIYDGEHIALVFDGNNTLKQRYLYGPAIDQVLAEDTGTQTRWMLADHQGSIRQIVDNTGSLLNQITYDSYGNITHQTNPSVTFRFGYTGREWDGETGQYYYRARYYDARVGRFLSTDPIGFAAGDANLYRYVGNSPTNATDPSGEIAWVPIILGGVIIPIVASMIVPQPVQAPTHKCDFTPMRPWWHEAAVETSLSLGISGFSALGKAGVKGLAGLLDDAGRAGAGLIDDIGRGLVGRPPSRITPGSIGKINPGYRVIPGRTTNCANCAIATDAMLAGRAAQALPGIETPTKVLENLFRSKFMKASQGRIISEFENAGSGARGIVLGVYDNGRSHVFNVVNQKGVVRFLDGQTGVPANFSGFKQTYVMPTHLP
jgi:RHS repeat-associated protein